VNDREALVRRVDQCRNTEGLAEEDLLEARIRRQKGNYPGYAGYRQRGRAEARGAKRRRARARRRAGKLICELGLG